MNIAHPLKYHLYTYRRTYFIYTILYFLLLSASILTLNHLDDFYRYLSIAILLATFIFTIYNSFYEFTSLIHHYLSLKTIKSEFVLSSIIYSFINALLQTIISFCSYFIIKNIFEVDLTTYLGFNKLNFYVFTLLIHLTIFCVIGFVFLILRNLKYLRILLYLLGIIIVALISMDLMNSIIDFVYEIYTNPQLIISLYPLLSSITIIFWLLIWLRVKIINK